MTSSENSEDDGDREMRWRSLPGLNSTDLRDWMPGQEIIVVVCVVHPRASPGSVTSPSGWCLSSTHMGDSLNFRPIVSTMRMLNASPE